MRVVHAVRSDSFAGVERHVSVLAAAQVERGDQVALIGGDPDRMADATPRHGVDLHAGRTLSEVIGALIHVARDADVVHVHMTAAESAATLVSLVPRYGAPIVTTRHFAAKRGQSRLGGIATGLIRSRLAAQIAISHYVAEHIDGPSEVIHPGVRSVEPGPEPRSDVILVVQRLEPEKRTDVAIRAFADSELAQQGWRLQIAGDGSQRRSLEQLAYKLGVSTVTEFLGARQDVPELMARSGLLLAPCPVEGLGLVVLEAMAARLPVIASAAGGHLETLPSEGHPYCFRSNDIADAARILTQLAGDCRQRALLADLGLSRQRREFSPAAQAEHTDRCYRAVIAGQWTAESSTRPSAAPPGGNFMS